MSSTAAPASTVAATTSATNTAKSKEQKEEVDLLDEVRPPQRTEQFAHPQHLRCSHSQRCGWRSPCSPLLRLSLCALHALCRMTSSRSFSRRVSLPLLRLLPRQQLLLDARPHAVADRCWLVMWCGVVWLCRLDGGCGECSGRFAVGRQLGRRRRGRPVHRTAAHADTADTGYTATHRTHTHSNSTTPDRHTATPLTMTTPSIAFPFARCILQR